MRDEEKKERKISAAAGDGNVEATQIEVRQLDAQRSSVFGVLRCIFRSVPSAVCFLVAVAAIYSSFSLISHGTDKGTNDLAERTRTELYARISE